MKVYVAITEGNFGDLEAYAGVYGSLEEAQRKHPGTYEAGTYTFSGGRYWIKRSRWDDEDYEEEVDTGEEEEYNDGRAVVIREEEVEV